jgi:hypothetical protein
MDRREALKTGAAALAGVAATVAWNTPADAGPAGRYEQAIQHGHSVTVINPKHICYVEQNAAGKTLIHMSGRSTIETKVTIQQILDQLKDNDGKWLEIIE